MPGCRHHRPRKNPSDPSPRAPQPTDNASGTRDFHHAEIAWDAASNIISVIDQIHKSAGAGGVGGNRIFDGLYGLNGLHRLRRAEEGELDGSSISEQTRFEEWSLSQTGNWNERQLALGGSSVLTEDNTFSNANELLERDTNSSSPAEVTYTYNKVGQQTGDGGYSFKFDVWGRLRFVSTGGNVVVEQRYNGLGFRIAESAYTGPGEPPTAGP